MPLPLRRSVTAAAAAAAAALAVSPAARAALSPVAQTNLVSDNSAFNPQIIDPNMQDAWGLAIRPAGVGGHIWISNAFTGTSSEYMGDVNGVPLHQDGLKLVPIDTAGFADRGSALVTGQVYNAASDLAGQAAEFPVSGPAHNDSTTPPTSLGTVAGAAKFVFVTEDGTINAWLSNTATAMDSAPVVVNYSKTAPSFPYAANSVFTGVAMTTHAVTPAGVGTAAGNHVFAADFRNNHVEVFDDQWRDVTSSVAFQTPADVGGLHAYNVQDIANHLYVTYAQFNPNGDEGFEQTSGPGLGHLVEYNEDGTLVRDFADAGHLNAPWGVAVAPATFGNLGGDLLVSNFGDGTIAAFDPTTGAYIDDLRTAAGNPVAVDGIWALAFGNGASLGDANALYFTAGPNNEEDGLFGRLNVAPVPEPVAAAVTIAGVAGLLARRRRTPGNA